MAIARIAYARPVGGRLTVPVMNALEGGSTQDWKEGAILRSSGGYAIKAAAGTEALTLGIAQKDASGTQGTLVEFIPALPDIIFEFTLDDSVGTPLTSLQTHMWETYGWAVDANGYYYIDTQQPGNGVRLLDFVDPVGTAQARVLGVFCVQGTVWA